MSFVLPHGMIKASPDDWSQTREVSQQHVVPGYGILGTRQYSLQYTVHDSNVVYSN
jgi:hypothetical protein